MLREGVESLALVVSDDIYRTVVCQGYDGINAAVYKPEVVVTVGRYDHLG